jgi:hypothetical protein
MKPAARKTTAACTDSSGGASDGKPVLGGPGGSGRAGTGNCGSRDIGSLLRGGGTGTADTCGGVVRVGVARLAVGGPAALCLRASLRGFCPSPGWRVQRSGDRRGCCPGCVTAGHRYCLRHEFGWASGTVTGHVLASRPGGHGSLHSVGSEAGTRTTGPGEKIPGTTKARTPGPGLALSNFLYL